MAEMVTWAELAEMEPDFSARVRSRFEAGAHKTIATLRRDGSPRISGIEAQFAGDELLFGGMWRSVKALDLRRDGRFALHSASVDPPEWEGDAKVSGRAEEIEDDATKRALVSGGGAPPPEGPFHLFRARIVEAVTVGLSEARDSLVIEHWKADGAGVRTMRR